MIWQLCLSRAQSIGNEANFVVVFASDEWAHLATRQPLPFDDKGTAIVCRLVDQKPTFWDQWVPSVCRYIKLTVIFLQYFL